jgi:hypothetical protein
MLNKLYISPHPVLSAQTYNFVQLLDVYHNGICALILLLAAILMTGHCRLWLFFLDLHATSHSSILFKAVSSTNFCFSPPTATMLFTITLYSPWKSLVHMYQSCIREYSHLDDEFSLWSRSQFKTQGQFLPSLFLWSTGHWSDLHCVTCQSYLLDTAGQFLPSWFIWSTLISIVWHTRAICQTLLASF